MIKKEKKGKLAKLKQTKPEFRDPLWEFYYKHEAKILAKKDLAIKAAAALVIATILAAGINLFLNYKRSQGQEALAKAFEIYNASVVKPEEVKDAKGRVYTDREQKYKEAAAEFDKVAATYSDQARLARFYAALSRKHFDINKAQSEFEALSKEADDLGFWAKVALAETYAAAGDYDKALSLYNQMKENPGQLTKSLILYNIGALLELQGKTKEATEAYFQSATLARSSTAGRKAASRLEALDEELYKKLPEDKPEAEEEI
ncbi:MAG: tetratricopeptide repeat protein [Acidobacteriota bacterium]|nr:tetratricopeptide repeat protein [Blastocatellia bacterium]MDW8413359.1 tetratricopeptide repeat protein [Acidobacteriota bacterium]